MDFAERYLGDGVYASFDGYHVVLDLRGQDSTTRIALEPAVFSALQTYRYDMCKLADDAYKEANHETDN